MLPTSFIRSRTSGNSLLSGSTNTTTSPCVPSTGAHPSRSFILFPTCNTSLTNLQNQPELDKKAQWRTQNVKVLGCPRSSRKCCLIQKNRCAFFPPLGIFYLMAVHNRRLFLHVPARKTSWANRVGFELTGACPPPLFSSVVLRMDLSGRCANIVVSTGHKKEALKALKSPLNPRKAA